MKKNAVTVFLFLFIGILLVTACSGQEPEGDELVAQGV